MFPEICKRRERAEGMDWSRDMFGAGGRALQRRGGGELPRMPA